MSEAPATAVYAKAFKAARAQADAERTFALAHPTAPGSQAILKSSKKVEIGSAAKNEVKSHVQKLRQAQDAILPSLKGAQIGGQVLYSVQRAYNGIALAVSPNKISEIAKLPGVKAVHPLHPKYPSITFSDIDFLRARTASPNGGLWTTGGVLGENIKIADIDSGLDYVHTNFGGPGDCCRPMPAFPTPVHFLMLLSTQRKLGAASISSVTPITRTIRLLAYLTRIPTPLTVIHPDQVLVTAQLRPA